MIDSIELNTVFCNTSGYLVEGDSLIWLKSLPTETVDLIFADPPYNIKKAEWDKFKSQDHYIDWSIKWISEAARILKKSGTFYICGFSEILADLKQPSMKFFKSCKWLVWYYKNKANLSSDWGRSHESILCLRKSHNFILNIDDIRIPYNAHTLRYPARSQGQSSQFAGKKNRKSIWVPHPKGAKPKDIIEIPTLCNSMQEKTEHPTQKPEELLRKIILASSNDNDLVVDPFSGSGTTLVVADQLKRKWAGCEKNHDYNIIAIERLKNVPEKTKEEWIEFDKKNLYRRNSAQ